MKQEGFREDFANRFFPFFVCPLYERRLDVLYYLFYMYPEVSNLLAPFEILGLLGYNWPGNVREVQRVGEVAAWRKAMRERSPTAKPRPLLALSDSTLRLADYTSLAPHRLSEFEERLRINTVNIKKLDGVLKRYGIGIDVRDAEPVFRQGCTVTTMYKEDSGLELKYCEPHPDWSRLEKGLDLFCGLFCLSPKQNADLLDIGKWDEPRYLRKMITPFRRLRKRNYKLIRKLVKFVGRTLHENNPSTKRDFALEIEGRLGEITATDYRELLKPPSETEITGKMVAVLEALHPQPASPVEDSQSEVVASHPVSSLVQEAASKCRIYEDMDIDAKRSLIEQCIREADGNISRAARKAGMPRTTFVNRMKKIGISPILDN